MHNYALSYTSSFLSAQQLEYNLLAFTFQHFLSFYVQFQVVAAMGTLFQNTVYMWTQQGVTASVTENFIIVIFQICFTDPTVNYYFVKLITSMC